MSKVYCEYCGVSKTDVRSLTSGRCIRHPEGPNKGNHKLYEGGEKSNYTCKYCGYKSSNLVSLTSARCFRHPKVTNKWYHSPSL